MNLLERKDGKNLVLILAVWFIYAMLYVELKAYAPDQIYSGILQASGSVLTIAVTTIMAFWLWNNAPAESVTKKIFAFYLFSRICIIFDEVIYNYFYNIVHVKSGQLSDFWISTYNIPYLGWLIFMFLVFVSIVPKIKASIKTKFNFALYIPFAALAISLIFTFLLNFTMLANESSLAKFYDVADSVLQLSNFILALVCFAMAKNKGLFYFSLGYVVTVAADYSMEAQLFSQHFRVGSFMEMVLTLGTLLIIYGLYNFKKSGNYKEDAENWVTKVNNLKPQLTLWTFFFCVVMSSAFLFATHVSSLRTVFF